MDRLGMIYMCAAWLMMGLVLGYIIADQDVIRMEPSITMEELTR